MKHFKRSIPGESKRVNIVYCEVKWNRLIFKCRLTDRSSAKTLMAGRHSVLCQTKQAIWYSAESFSALFLLEFFVVYGLNTLSRNLKQTPPSFTYFFLKLEDFCRLILHPRSSLWKTHYKRNKKPPGEKCPPNENSSFRGEMWVAHCIRDLFVMTHYSKVTRSVWQRPL